MTTKIKDKADDEASPLDGLIEQAEANTAPPTVAPPPPSDGLEDDLFFALKMAQAAARGGIYWLTPEQFEGLWGDHTLRGIAAPGAEIMRRNGWEMAGLMSKYGPYIALLGAIAPPTMATVQAYKNATRPQPVPEPAPPPEASHGN